MAHLSVSAREYPGSVLNASFEIVRPMEFFAYGGPRLREPRIKHGWESVFELFERDESRYRE